MRDDTRVKMGGWEEPSGLEKRGKWRREGIEGKERTSQLRIKRCRRRMKEQQEEKQLQSVFCFHKMTTVHESLNCGVH